MTTIVQPSYADSAFQYGQYVKDALANSYQSIQQPGEVQNRALAVLRTSVGVASVYFHPGAAIAGGIATAILPQVAKPILSGSEAMITGLWNKMTANQKALATAAGVAATYGGFSYLTLPATIFSAKIGAERTLDNLNKQNVAYVTQKVEETIDKY